MEVREASAVYSVMGEFATAEELLAATRHAYAAGYRRMEAYSPMPVHGLAEALGPRRDRLSPMVFLGGLVGGLGGFFMQWFASVVHYPLNVGGRPLNSWPAFIPITFEATVLVAGITAVLGMLGLNGLPRPYHPVFNTPNFALASDDRFFLSIQGTDPLFDREGTAKFLEGQGARLVNEVPF